MFVLRICVCWFISDAARRLRGECAGRVCITHAVIKACRGQGCKTPRALYISVLNGDE